ncbi:DNA damage-inducible protein 1 [Taxawa tesnikishii (nom. ined.)]|nr:DNA damage-inducible protein 1 [Dothideales sp. JES 119]
MPAQRIQQRQRGAQEARPGDRMTPEAIETVRLQCVGNPAALAQMREQTPDLADAINDSALFRERFEALVRNQQERERERQEQLRLLNEDPFNVEAQKKIEEMIRQERVMENLQHAYEHNPEGKHKHKHTTAQTVQG